MQITSTKRTHVPQNIAQTKVAAETPAPASDEPKDISRLSAGHQTGVATTMDWNSKYGNAAGGVLGAALTLPAVYAGLLGGSVAGAVAGLSVGPAVGVLSGASGLELVGKVFTTGGDVAKAFTIAGAAAGLVGGWMVGQKVGESVAAVPLSAVAYPVGFAKGMASGKAPAQPQEPEEKKEVVELIRRPSGLTKGAAGMLGGVGAISVGLGGVAIGAASGGGVGLIAGVLAGDVNLASLGTATLIGGGVGVALGGAVGGIGGYSIATTSGRMLGWAKNKIVPDKEGEALEKLRTEVAGKLETFEDLSSRLDAETDHAAADFTKRQSELEDRQKETGEYVEVRDSEVEALAEEGRVYEQTENDKLDRRQEVLDRDNAAIEETIESDAAGRLAEKRVPTDKKYKELHQELDGVRDAHQQRDDHIAGIEAEQAAEIEAKVVAQYDQKMVPVKEHYKELHAEQDEREVQLKDWDQKVTTEDQRLDGVITDKGMADFKSREPGLEREFEGHERELRQDFSNKTTAANEEHKDLVEQADSKLLSDKREAKRRHDRDMSQADTDHKQAMDRERSSHSSRMENERSDHTRGMRDLDRDFEQKMDRLESSHRQRMAALGAKQGSLQSEESELSREKPQLERELSQVERDLREARSALRDAESRWDREVGQAESDRNAAVRERNSVANDLRNTESAISEAENERGKWVRQKAQVDSLIVGLRAERDRLQKILDKLG